MNTKIATIAKTALILLFFLLILKSNYSQEHDIGLRKITLQLKWKHQFQFAGYYAAIEKGFYKDVGLDVHLLEAVEGIEPADAVFDGTADFGVSTTDIVLMRAEGKKAVIIASIFQHSAQILVASHKAGIDHIHDLKGKKIDMEPHAADLITFMNDEGLTLEDCIISDHSFNVNRLLSGEVDAMSAYLTDEPFILRENQFEYTIISPAMGGIDFYGDILFTSEDMIHNDEELVKAFKRASIKGWNYAMNNVNELIDITYNKYSKRHSKEHLKFEAQKMQRLILPNVIEIGYSNKGRWKHIIETYYNTMMIDEAIELEGLFFEDYLPKEKQIAWESILILLSIIFIIVSIASFYIYSTQKLKSEINKREEIQQTLSESEKRLSLLMQQSPSVIEIYDLNGLQISVNKAYEELWNFPASHTLRKFNVLKSKEVEDSGLMAYVKRAYKGESVKVPEYKFDSTGETEAQGEGRVRWLSTRIYPLKDQSGNTTNIVITHEDITERKEIEEELKKHKTDLEKLIKERTEELENKNIELERFNKLFVGREFRINELKEKINYLEKNINKQ